MAHQDASWGSSVGGWGHVAATESETDMPWGSATSETPAVVNVWEEANLVGRGPALSPALMRNKYRP